MQQTSTQIYVLLATILGSFLTPFMSSSINISLPYIGKEFSIDAVMLSWVASTFLLSAAIFLVPFGRISDIIGRKKVFILGVFFFTITSFILAVINNIHLLLILRFIQGIGASMIFCTNIALLSLHYPPEKRGKAMGLLVTSVYLGGSIGPFVGGYLTQHFGWRSLFLLNAFLGLLILFFSLTKIKEEHPENNESFDWKGSIIYGIALAFLMYGFSILPSLSGFILSASGLIGIIIFFKFERKTISPVLDISLLLNNKVFAMSNIAALINYSATFAIGFLLSLYLQYIKGYTPSNAGTILIIQPLVMALFSSFAGKLSDKIEPRILSSVGMSINSLSLFLFFFFNENTNLNLLILNLILIGIGFAFFSSPNMNAIMSSIPKTQFGIGSAIQSTMRLVGQMLSMGIVMITLTLIVGKVQITPEYHIQLMASIKAVFLIFGILCLIGVFASSARGKVR